MPNDHPLREFEIGKDGRAEALYAVLERRAIAIAEGKPWHWKDLIAGILLSGLPITVRQIHYWLRQPWGIAVYEEFNTHVLDSTKDKLDQFFTEAVDKQLDDAIHGPNPKARAAAYANVLNTAKAIGYFTEVEHNAEGRRPDITVLVGLYSQPIAFNAANRPQLSEPVTIDGISKTPDTPISQVIPNNPSTET